MIEKALRGITVMAKNLTYKKFLKERDLFNNFKQTTNLFDNTDYPPTTNEELIKQLKTSNKIEVFCYVISKLQQNYNFYLDDYKFNNLRNKSSESDFTENDLLQILNICHNYSCYIIFFIGFLLCKNYEPNSVIKTINENNPLKEYLIKTDSLEIATKINKREQLFNIIFNKIQYINSLLINYNELRSNGPSLDDDTVKTRIAYSIYCEYGLKKTVKYMAYKDKGRQKDLRPKFFSVLFNLQIKRPELNIFYKDKFKEFLERYCNNELTVESYIETLNFTLNAIKTTTIDLNSDLEVSNVDLEIQNEYIHMLELYNDCYNRCMKAINELKPSINEYMSIIILDNRCDFDEIWNAYTFQENRLVFSIAILLHEKRSEWREVLNYYFHSGKHVMIAQNPILDKKDSDEYTVHPMLQRPITTNIVSKEISRSKYNTQTADKIISKWDSKTYDIAKMYDFLRIIFCLQMEHIILVNENSFNYIFQQQIKAYNADKNSEILSFDIPIDIDNVMRHRNNDKEMLFHEIVVLLDRGYYFNDIFPYYKDILN